MGGSLLEVSSQEGARRVALRYLDQASKASERLHDTDDPGALHDFRVGLRRLRSCLRAYREIFGDRLAKKQRSRLGKIAGRTNPGRDAEVQLELVTKLGARAAPHERPGVTLVADQLERQKDEAYAHVRDELYRRFAKLQTSVREELSVYSVTYRVGEARREPRFCEAAADAMEVELDALSGALSQVKGIEDEAIAHDARIHGKRLRYLLEPFRGEKDLAKPLVKRLKALQDLLGDLNDLHNLAATVGETLEASALEGARRLREAATGVGGELHEELAAAERPGLVALLQRTHGDRTRLLDDLLGGWLVEDGALVQLEADLRSFTASLRGRPPSGVEIERKYLLSGLPPACEGVTPLELDQGYVPGERLVERIRRVRDGGAEKFLRTVKSGRGLTRIEIEEECDRGTFETLWALTEGKRVQKKRYRVESDGFTWEIDAFTDRELFLAEVELDDPETEVTVPEWLAPHLVREVTNEDTYVNVNLAK